MLFIKANAIQHLSDARYFAAKGVTWLTFHFDEGAIEHIEPSVARAMFEWVQGVRITGAFGGLLAAAELREWQQLLGIETLQVGMFADAATLAALAPTPVIRTWVVEAFTNIEVLQRAFTSLAPFVEAFELDFQKNGIAFQQLTAPDAMISLIELATLTAQFPIILAIDFELAELKTLLADLPNLHGLVLRGGAEERVGLKSYDELDDIFDALEDYAL